MTMKARIARHLMSRRLGLGFVNRVGVGLGRIRLVVSMARTDLGLAVVLVRIPGLRDLIPPSFPPKNGRNAKECNARDAGTYPDASVGSRRQPPCRCFAGRLRAGGRVRRLLDVRTAKGRKEVRR